MSLGKLSSQRKEPTQSCWANRTLGKVWLPTRYQILANMAQAEMLLLCGMAFTAMLQDKHFCTGLKQGITIGTLST